MFASLKSKIKEETGNDISKITSSWRSGAFSNRAPQPDNATPTTLVGGGGGDYMGDAVSPQLESYLRERVSGPVVDVLKLERDHALQLDEKLKERDKIWEKRLEELKESFNTIQGEEARAAQAVARMAQAEAAQELSRRKEMEKRLQALQESATDALAAQDKLDSLTEEFESARREWGRERTELKVALGRAESELRNISDDLILVKASLPQGHQNFAYDEEETIMTTDNEELNSLRRQQAVLSRQLQEARLALADVKTSWSGQIASLETQVARLSRQAGEEGAERRRALADKEGLKSELDFALEEINKMRESLANSEAKVARLNGETRSLVAELKKLRSDAERQAETDNELKKQLKDSLEEIEGLKKSLNEERETVARLRISLSESEKDNVEKQGDLENMKSLLIDLQNECNALQRQCQKERRDKDDALLRNAQMSQSVELSQCDIRHQESEMLDLKTKISQLEEMIAQLREEQANCLQIQKSENTRLNKIEMLSKQNEELLRSQENSKSTLEEYENQMVDKNKNIKILQNRIADMKKTLQREIQSGKTDVTSAEDADISRRYLKHVVMRFLTARELEARQLTRALATLLRLSAQEEALLHAALPPRGGISAWFGNLSPT